MVKYLLQPWFDIIARDLRAAETFMRDDEDLAYPVGYHLQQAAEKLIKVVITAHDLDVRRSHDIEGLLDDVPQDFLLRAEFQSLTALTEFATAGRYPGEPEPSLSLAEARDWYQKISALTKKVRAYYPDTELPNDES